MAMDEVIFSLQVRYGGCRCPAVPGFDTARIRGVDVKSHPVDQRKPEGMLSGIAHNVPGQLGGRAPRLTVLSALSLHLDEQGSLY